MIDLADDSVTGDHLAHHLGLWLNHPIEYRRMSDDVLAHSDLLTRPAAAVDDGRLAGHADLVALRERFPFLQRVDEWLSGRDAATRVAATRPTPGGVVLR